MAADTKPSEREAFEAWCCKRWGGDRGGDNFLRHSTGTYAGEYVKGNVQFAWCAWQAARLAAPPAGEQAQPLRDLFTLQDIADACMAAEINDSKFESVVIALHSNRKATE